MAGETETTYLDNPAAEQQAAGELRRRRRYGEKTRRATAASYGFGRNMQTWGADKGGYLGEATAEAGEFLQDRTRNISGELRRDRQAAKSALSGKPDESPKDNNAPIRVATNRFLRRAWLNLVTSWGLTLLYIDIHVFLRWVFGERFFCKLGHEWVPRQLAGGEQSKTLNFFLGLAEIIALIGLNLLALFLVVLACFMVYLLVDIITHPVRSIWTYGFEVLWPIFRAYFGI